MWAPSHWTVFKAWSHHWLIQWAQDSWILKLNCPVYSQYLAGFLARFFTLLPYFQIFGEHHSHVFFRWYFIWFKVLYFTNRCCAYVYCCPDCQNADGDEIIGIAAYTESGRMCQAWIANEPHPHPYHDNSTYPEKSVRAAGNKCRNPAIGWWSGRVWCYTTDPSVKWEHCDVPFCSSECTYLVVLRLFNSWNN